MPLAEVTAAFSERCGGEYDRPITIRYVGLILRRTLGIRPYKSHGI
jgi:hypothetical protein